MKVEKYFDYFRYMRTEHEANRLLEHSLRNKALKRGWVSDDGTKTHPWVVRGLLRW